VRKMEGADITIERLAFVSRAIESGLTRNQVFAAHLGAAPREDLIPFVADFLLQLEDVNWSIISGVANDAVVISVRNLGYSRNAGGFVKACFAEIGNPFAEAFQRLGGRIRPSAVTPAPQRAPKVLSPRQAGPPGVGLDCGDGVVG